MTSFETSFGLTPFFRPVDRIDQLANVFDAFNLPRADLAAPSYDIERVSDTAYRIAVVVPGFDEADIDIEEQDGVLTLRGNANEETSASDGDAPQEQEHYLYRGIRRRNFVHRFRLDDHIRVVDAELDNGLLYINLTRDIPEVEKPRKIGIAKALKRK